MKDTQDPQCLGEASRKALSGVASAGTQGRATTVAAALVQAMKDTKDPHALSGLAKALSVAAHLEPKDAATVSGAAATALVQAIKDTNNPFTPLPAAAHAMSFSTGGAAGTPNAATVAATLVQALKVKDTKEPLSPCLPWPQCLSAVAARMEPPAAAAAVVAARLLLSRP